MESRRIFKSFCWSQYDGGTASPSTRATMWELFPELFCDPQEIPSQDPIDDLFVVAALIQEFCELRELLRLDHCQIIIEFPWREDSRMALDIVNQFLFIDDIIQPEAYVFGTGQVHHILNIFDDQFTFPAPEEIANPIDADHAACFGTGEDLFVGDIAGVLAQSLRIGMGKDHRLRGSFERLHRRPITHMRQIYNHP